MSSRHKLSFWAVLGPGLLLAATGVGGGDLATATFVGGVLGTTVLWAIALGAFMKFVVTEGLARWQLATGETLIEGVVRRLGPVVVWIFLPYFLLWSFFVGSAQMSANGVSLHAMIPVFENANTGKIVFGALSSLFGLAIVLRGGYRGFDIAMKVCIGVMFVTVAITAVALWPGTGSVLRGLLVPTIPRTDPEAIVWTVSLIGGIGGTLTVLSYGYWMREEGRTHPSDLRTCRIDLAASYFMMALFGILMVIVGQTVKIEGEGTGMLIVLSDRLGEELGPAGKWLFLAGTFGAVFSSLLGVWQAAPYLFAECWRLGVQRDPNAVDTRAPPYRRFLLVLAFVPMIGLFGSFRDVQQIYTFIGAYIFPMLALVLIVFNSRAAWVGRRFKNHPVTVVALAAVLVFFTWLAIENIQT
ncbi:MAG TPA: Nramp family divalent metal transporter [Gammaproteobacteria bacterium]|nr:Nramp family divalent metal transporter [Gammaproteobacteria bacterium]